MSRQVELGPVMVPISTGCRGCVTSTTAAPLRRPMMAYSRPVLRSLKPQMSFALVGRVLNSLSFIHRRRSRPRQAKGPALPSWHVAAVGALSSMSTTSPASFSSPMPF